MLVSEIANRLATNVPALAARVHQAAELSELIAKAALPASPVSAYVLPMGMSARGPGEASTGFFIQDYDETVGVLLVIRSAGDVAGSRALPRIDELAEATMTALCGWAPAEEPGVLRLVSARLLPAESGLILHQTDFALHRQLRVNT